MASAGICILNTLLAITLLMSSTAADTDKDYDYDYNIGHLDAQPETYLGEPNGEMTTPKTMIPTSSETSGEMLSSLGIPTTATTTQKDHSNSTTTDETTHFTTNEIQTSQLSPADLFDASFLLDEIICPSDGYLNICGLVLSLMNHTVGPCEDFYQYACGGLRANPELLDHDAGSEVNRKLKGQILTVNGKDSTSYGQLRKFYDSCFAYRVIQDRTEKINKVITEVKKVGRFHSMQSWKANPVDITDLLADFFKLDSTPFFDILLDKHEGNSSKFVLKLVPPIKTPSFLEKKQFLNTKVCEKNHRGWNEKLVANVNIAGYIKNILESLPDFQGTNSSNSITEIIKNLQENIVEVIAKYMPFEDYFRWILVTKQYEVMTVEDLQRNFIMVNWTRLISKLLTQTVENSMEVHVYYKPYLDQLFHYLSEIDTRLLHNSLLAMFTSELYHDTVNPTSSDGKEYCLTTTKELLPDVAASLYLQTFPNDTSGHIQQVFSMVKKAMGEQINDSRQLDQQSKKSLFEKLGTLDVVTGGGKEILGDLNRLDRRMKNYNISNTNYLANTINLRKRKRQLMYTLFSKDASAEEQLWTYFISPLQTQEPLFYNYHKIVVPYALLPRGRVGAIFSQYNVAELGITLARMIAHHFDFTGIHYGPNGTKEDTVSEDVYLSYLSDLKHQASEKASKMDKSVCKHRRSRSLLANDFISDQAALNMALKVFKSDNRSTKELQLFFLAMAQASCQKQTMWDGPAPLSLHLQLPLPARINAVFTQSPLFSSAFRCSVGSNMNPLDKTPAFPED